MRVLDDVDRLLAVARTQGNQLLRPVELGQLAGVAPARMEAALVAAVAIGQLVRRGRCYGPPARADRTPSLGEAVKYLRGLAGLTQAEAAKRAGMSQPQWAALEKRSPDPRVGTLVRMARALGCRPYHLLPG